MRTAGLSLQTAAPGWYRIGAAGPAADDVLLRIDFSDGRAIERCVRTGRDVLRVPPGVVRVTARRMTSMGDVEIELLAVNPLSALFAVLGRGLAFYLRRPESFMRSARSALRLVARGEIGEIWRRVSRQGGARDARVPTEAGLPAVPLRPRASGGPIRAVAFGPGLAFEGASISLFELLRGLKEREGCEVSAISPKDGALRRWYVAAGIACEIDSGFNSAPLTIGDHDRDIERLARSFDAFRTDVVIANTIRAHAAVEAAYRAGIPALWIIRESEPWPGVLDDASAAIQARATACLGTAWRLVFVADATKAAWGRFAGVSSATVIRNALDARRFPMVERAGARRMLALADGDTMVLAVGTVSERKGQVDLLDAMAALPARQAERTRIFMVGDRDTPEAATIRGRAKALAAGRQERIHFIRETDDVSAYFAAADIFVSCSRFESYPRTVLEAMAAHLPIVATPVFGVREQVEEGLSAHFYDPGDVPALAAALSRLMDDAAYRRTLAEGAAVRAGALPTFDAMVADYAVLLRAAVAARP